MMTPTTKGIAFGLLLTTTAAPQAKNHWNIPVDPTGTWLYVDNCDQKINPTTVVLADLKIRPGNHLHITKRGGYFYKWPETGIDRRMIAAFADDAGNLLLPGKRPRTMTAVTPNAVCGDAATDVEGDFVVRKSMRVTVPLGARTLMFSAPDSHFLDNVSKAYRVRIDRN